MSNWYKSGKTIIKEQISSIVDKLEDIDPTIRMIVGEQIVRDVEFGKYDVRNYDSAITNYLINYILSDLLNMLDRHGAKYVLMDLYPNE